MCVSVLEAVSKLKRMHTQIQYFAQGGHKKIASLVARDSKSSPNVAKQNLSRESRSPIVAVVSLFFLSSTFSCY